MPKDQDLTKEETKGLREIAMRWYGWGSPVGVGLFVFLLGAAFAVTAIGIKQISEMGPAPATYMTQEQR